MEVREDPVAIIQELKQRLAEAEDTLRALRYGEVDAVVAAGPGGNRVYTLKGADEPYRLLVQEMAEGALTISAEGLILFSNQQFADTVASPLERVIGCKLHEFLDPSCLETAGALLECARRESVKAEIQLRKANGRSFPAYVSLNRLNIEGMDGFCMVVTDLTEQKRNEELAVAEKLARSILEQAAEAILVLDLDGRVVRASRAADRLAGTSVLLREFEDVFQIRSPGGLSFSSESILAMARSNDRGEPLEMTATNAGGKTCDILFSVAPLGGSNTGLLGCIVHLTDITHRKHIEKTLRESEEMYRSLADAMPQIVYVNRPDGICEFVNRRWLEFTGESARTHSADFARNSRFHPEDRATTLEQWERSVATGQIFEVERRLLRHDGEYRWHLSRAVPIRDEDGSIIKWVGTSTDIHEFKRTEALLRESEARLAALAETVPEILFTCRPDGQADYGSPRAYQYTGMAPGAMHGAGWLDTVHHEDAATVRESWTASIRSLQPFSVEFRMRRADGMYRWMHARAVPMLGPKGEILKWFGTCSDIDDYKLLEQSLRKRSAELARSNEELQRFAHIVSHDLQEPLRSIGAMSQLLRRHYADTSDEETEALFGHILGGVKRMSDLIRDLLQYSHVSSEAGVELKPVDCESLLSFALMNLQAQVAETGAIITRDPMPLVMGDEQLVRVFQNLLGNALKYRGDKAPRIHVSASRKNGDWIISVRDEGIGLHMQDAERIFGVFQRLHSRTAYEGTGIGLAICRKIVEWCGGRVWVESAPGAGATFSFSLQAAGETASSGGKQ